MAQQLDTLSNYMDRTQAIAQITGSATPTIGTTPEASFQGAITAIDRFAEPQTITVNAGTIGVTALFLSEFTPEVGDIVILRNDSTLRVLNATEAAVLYTLA